MHIPGGAQYGVAKDANMTVLKLASCSDNHLRSPDVITALKWVLANADRPAAVSTACGICLTLKAFGAPSSSNPIAIYTMRTKHSQHEVNAATGTNHCACTVGVDCSRGVFRRLAFLSELPPRQRALRPPSQTSSPPTSPWSRQQVCVWPHLYVRHNFRVCHPLLVAASLQACIAVVNRSRDGKQMIVKMRLQRIP